MSSWTFSAKVDVTKLEQLVRKMGTVDDMLMDVAQQTAEQVVKNIEIKDVIDTGALHDSIRAERRGNLTVVRDGVPYGVYNEFGTYKMAARPFFIPAIERAGDVISRKFKELLR